jgi:hypothetical protein
LRGSAVLPELSVIGAIATSIGLCCSSVLPFAVSTCSPGV